MWNLLQEIFLLTRTSCFIWTVVLLSLVCVKLSYVNISEGKLCVRHRGWSFLKGLTIFSTYPFTSILSFPVRNSCCPWWLHPHLESVLVVKDLGIQFTRCEIFGQKTKQFIEQHRVVDVIINEVITMVCIWEFISSFFNSGRKKTFS